MSICLINAALEDDHADLRERKLIKENYEFKAIANTKGDVYKYVSLTTASHNLQTVPLSIRSILTQCFWSTTAHIFCIRGIHTTNIGLHAVGAGCV